MLRSVPVPFQAILWPLLGAVLCLAVGRLLPAWLRRVLTAAAAGASLVVIWSLRSGGLERVELSWVPLNIFRAGLTISTAGLAVPAALVLATVAFALALGIGGRQARDPWLGLLLFLLAGALTLTLAANLLTMAIGSALLDLTLIALALWCDESSDEADPGRTCRPLPLTAAVPGLASTLVLVLCALRLDAEVGHTMIPARQIPAPILLLAGVAGLLRAQVFPLHARHVKGPTGAAALLLPTGAGLYLLARAQAVAPIIPTEGVPALLGSLALLAGGLIAWSGGAAARQILGQEPGGLWHGLSIHQVGGGLLFVLLLPRMSPWPMLSMLLALALLALWWGANRDALPLALPAWIQPVRQRLEPWRLQQFEPWRQQLSERLPSLLRRLGSWLARRGAVLLPALAIVSLAGLPLTAGARARWPLYAALLRDRNPALLALLVADALLAAGLWLGLRSLSTSTRHPRPLSLFGMLFLAAVLIVAGLGGGERVGWQAVRISDVSALGMGLLYILPWLAGIWLASLAARWSRVAPMVRSIVGLDWLFRAASRIGHYLEGVGYWLGQVGEGEGWWGWALIILALGAIFLTGR
jgi:hypothetical protein